MTRTCFRIQSGNTTSRICIFLYISAKLLSSNGNRPARRLNNITPHDHASALAPSYPLPRTISGAVNAGVPHAVWRSPSFLHSGKAESPKSDTFRFPCSSINKFCGFKSRCATPFW
ncbi:hypothetical protein HanIR_Chr13g0666491 [Helianthus annuus]|nr:hypothetical protein HanIR_Chr13g0666491 [Helianthus annuus]